MYKTKDSGERTSFGTGSQRDTNTGKPRYDLIPVQALKRLADLYARGAEKYDDWNWYKGQPFSRLYESALRHLMQWREGEVTEDHLAAVCWNLFAIMTFQEENRQGLDDIMTIDKVQSPPAKPKTPMSHNITPPPNFYVAGDSPTYYEVYRGAE